MTKALIAGERDPQVLTDLARARTRTTAPALRDALVGRFTDHHAFLCRAVIDRIDGITATIDQLTERINDELRPKQPAVSRLSNIPGIGARQAPVRVAEIGTDMARFPAARAFVVLGRDVFRQPGLLADKPAATAAPSRSSRS